MPQDVTPLITALSRKYRLDPQAVIAVARGEGGTGYGRVGDGGHAFGPFQLNDAGGVLTGRPGDHQAFANSPQGLEFALSGMAKAGAGGLTGEAAVRRIIGSYERPADKQTSIANAIGRLGGVPNGAAANPLGQTPGALSPPVVSPPSVPSGDLRQQTLRTLLQARRSGSSDRSGVIAALAQQRAPQPPPEHVGNLATPDGGKIPVVNETGGPVPKEASEVVAAAQRFIGTPYAWGGGGPGGPSKGFGRGAGTVGFDCSSLLQYAYAQQGKKIPRTTYAQFRSGQSVDAKALQPGDAVFFHPDPNGPEHVGIFVGQGKYIQAPKTGDVVKVSNLADRGDYMGARRW